MIQIQYCVVRGNLKDFVGNTKNIYSWKDLQVIGWSVASKDRSLLLRQGMSYLLLYDNHLKFWWLKQLSELFPVPWDSYLVCARREFPLWVLPVTTEVPAVLRWFSWAWMVPNSLIHMSEGWHCYQHDLSLQESLFLRRVAWASSQCGLRKARKWEEKLFFLEA